MVSAFTVAFKNAGVKAPRLHVDSGLGRFTPKRKPVTRKEKNRLLTWQLDSLLTALRSRGDPRSQGYRTIVAQRLGSYRVSTCRKAVNLLRNQITTMTSQTQPVSRALPVYRTASVAQALNAQGLADLTAHDEVSQPLRKLSSFTYSYILSKRGYLDYMQWITKALRKEESR